MPGVGAQASVKRVALDNARRCTAVSDRIRAATGNLVNGAHAVLAVHRYDLFGRASKRPSDQHADTVRHDIRVPALDYRASDAIGSGS
jgi:DNA-binding FrmR family transcriptional regulator